MDYFICIEKIEYVYLLLIISLSSILMPKHFERRSFLFKFKIKFLFFAPFFLPSMNICVFTSSPHNARTHFCFSYISIKMEMTHKYYWIFGIFVCVCVFFSSSAKTLFCFRWKYAIRAMSNMMGITFHRRKTVSL